MDDEMPMTMTDIELRSGDLKRLVATASILWPPKVIPDILHVDGRVFMRCGTNMVDKPTYRLATSMAITNINL